MKYVFIDTEGGVNQSSGLKSCGIVVTDESFNIERQREVFIDMNRDGSKREATDIKRNIPFNQMYCILRDYLTDKDSYVFGFSVLSDVMNIDQACERNKMPALTYDFFDVQKLCRVLLPEAQQFTLEGCVNALGITEQFTYHRSKEDARATARVLQKLCELKNMTVAQFIESYPHFTGRTQGFMGKYNLPEAGHTYANSSVGMFKIRIDLPLLYYKKKIGAMRTDGARDGVGIYYDVILDKLFKDRHPHRGVAKARNDCLVFGEFGKLRQRGLNKLEREESDFYKADAQLTVSKFVVSYECVGCIDEGTLTLLHGNTYLKQASDENKYVDKVLKKGVNPDKMIRKYYTADTFEQTLRRNTKWNYGDRNKEIQLDTVPFDDVQPQEGDGLYLPRVYASVLTNEFGNGEIVACRKEHFGYAANQQVIDIDSLQLADKSVRLVTRDNDGNVWGFIPVTGKVTFPLFDCKYELPMLIMRQLPKDTL